nr:hypothetical protein [Verrucomicrobiota bacterium]
VVLWLSASGKAGVMENGRLRAELQPVVNGGATVVAVDLFMQGEFLREGESDAPTRWVKNPREAAAFTFGYNHALLAQRVHDVLSVLAWLRSSDARPERIALVSLDSTAPVAAAAAALAGPAIDALVLDTKRFHFSEIRDLHDVNFLPGGAKYGDMPGLLALGAPRRLFLMGEDAKAPPMVSAAYEAAGVPDRLRVTADRDLPAAVQRAVESVK